MFFSLSLILLATAEPLLIKDKGNSSEIRNFLTQIRVPPCDVLPMVAFLSERKILYPGMKSSEFEISLVNQDSDTQSMSTELVNRKVARVSRRSSVYMLRML